jgi:putative ATP-dependent endonuclease of OLD family
VHAAGLKLGGIKEITDAAKAVNTRQERMVGSHYASDISLGLAPSDPDRLIRALRVYIDGGKRSISDASLGTANLLYLCLKALDFENLAIEGDRVHTFVAIEEPEAHLHPHLQRLVYRDFLRARTAHGRVQEREEVARPLSVLLTTHSPNIASVTPLESLVMLRRCSDGSTEASSAVGLSLEAQDIADLERYLDVSRGEMLFSRGIIFVEGESELYLVPTLAKLAGIDFEQLGITVCSIGGINFTPYVRLMSASGLNVPFAVITDGDPNLEGERIGVRRVRRLVEALTGSKVSPQEDEAKTLVRASKFGLFVGDHTFETDLFKSGRHRSMCNVLAQLTTSKIVKVRAKSWKADPDSLNRDRFISDIEKIGKGRFAQRLATQVKGSFWPKYIQRAVEYLQSKVT